MSLASDICVIVDRAYRNATTGQSVTREINQAIDRYVRGGGAVGDAKKALRREAKGIAQEYLRTRDALKGQEFATRFGPQAEDVARINALIAPDIERAEARMERQASKILGRVGRLVELAAKTGAPLRALVARARALAGRADRGLQAELDTATAAIDRTARMRGAMDAGVTTFRYAGPTVNLRPFCAATMERNGGIYTLAEIRQMDNGQGLPVETHCGGYNCRHRWVPVVSQIDGWETAHSEAFVTQSEGISEFARRAGVRLDPAAMAQAFRVGHPGYGMANTKVTAHIEKFSAISIRSNIVNLDGRTVGEMRRNVYVGPDGRLEIANELLGIDRRFRRQGLAKSHWQRMVSWADEVGVARVRVFAADEDGHQHWMRYGFEFDSDYDDVEAVRRLWRREFARATSKVYGIDADIASRLLAKCNQPYEFGSINATIDGKNVSGQKLKELLPGLTWHGVLDLSKTSASRKILDSYLARASKQTTQRKR